MAKAKDPDVVYQLKFTLRDIKPPVWRRVQVKDCSLAKLHAIIQTSLGWQDYHLHEFGIEDERFGDPMQWEDGFGGETRGQRHKQIDHIERVDLEHNVTTACRDRTCCRGS